MSKGEYKYTPEDLKQMQAFPLSRKVQIAQTRIIEWILKNKERVFVSFSGGKDSTVLLDLVRKVNPNIQAVFVNTGLEFPEIRKFALSKDRVTEIRPKMVFRDVVLKCGYPLIGKDVSQAIKLARSPHGNTGARNKLALQGRLYFTNRHTGEVQPSAFNMQQYMELCYLPIRISDECCGIMKENPVDQWQKKAKMLPFIGTMASESRRRRSAWLHLGCNAFDAKRPRSLPLSIWTEQDILRYILDFEIEICSVYGDVVPLFSRTKSGAEDSPCLRCTGRQRTGCVFCLYGAHIKSLGEGRFQSLAKTHPQLYDYCMRGGEWIDNPDYDPAIPIWNVSNPQWRNWNPKKIWAPNSKGLGYKVMLDMVNSVYGKDFIPYD